MPLQDLIYTFLVALCDQANISHLVANPLWLNSKEKSQSTHRALLEEQLPLPPLPLLLVQLQLISLPRGLQQKGTSTFGRKTQP